MKHFRFHAAIFSLILSTTASFAQQESTKIWGKEIMPQPFDTKPFHEIKIPRWLQETTGCGYTLSVMDSASRARAAEHGVSISEMGFIDPYYTYYDSKLLKKRSPHVPLDRLPKEIAEYKKLGVRILAVYPPSLQGEVYETHQDWRRISTNTTEIPQIDMKKFGHGGMLCLLGPYGDFFIEVQAEILTQFPEVDAFSYDGLHYGGVCYCEHCRKNFRKETGKEIPNLDLNDLEFRRYQHWADRRMEDLIRRLQEKLKKIKPEVALVTWSTNAGRFGHFLSIPRNMPARMNLLLDAPDQEFWCDETNRGLTIVPAFANAYMWSVTNHRVGFSEPYILTHGNPYGNDSFPPQEILRRMLLTATYGASPSVAVAQPARLQKGLYDCLDEVKRRKPWMIDKKPEYFAAILMSDNTKNFYGRSAGKVEERYLASVFGTFRAMVEEHVPVNLINDWNLNPEDLAKYKVLVLPNSACLDTKQVEAVEQFVKNGGGLVASLDTSLFDEFGSPRDNFALKDVFGVDYRGLPQTGPISKEIDVNFAKSIGPDYWEKRKNVFDFRQDMASILNQGKMKTYVGPESVTFKGPAVRVISHDPKNQILATIRTKSEAESVEIPAVISREHGKGRVVYFAAGLDSGYYLYPYPYQRLALKHTILWAAQDSPPINVTAPMCVHTTIMRQQTKEAERLIVHLYSDLNTSAAHAMPNEDVPLREEVVPIHDIRVVFKADYPIRKAHLQPEGKELEMKKTAEGIAVVVPKLEIHSMIVAELERK